MPSDVLNGLVAAQATNGITASELAASGMRVISRCLPGIICNQSAWLVAAEKSIPFIESARRTESDLSVSGFAKIVHELATGGNYDVQEPGIRLAYEVVARSWYSMVAEAIRTPVQAHEDNAAKWFAKKSQPKEPVKAEEAKVVGSPSSVGLSASRPSVNGNYDVRAMDAGLVDTIAKSTVNAIHGESPPLRSPIMEKPKPGGLSRGFRQSVLLKAEELESKAAGLRKLAEVIGAEYDDALWDLFGELLTGEK